MGIITLPANVEQDRQNGIKASSVHVQGNFDTLLDAVNKKLEYDGSIVPVADLPMGNHKLTGVATPTSGGDATNKTYVDSALALKANLASPTFTGTPKATTPASATDNSTRIPTTAHIINVLKTLYPVGSLYVAKSSVNTCPLATLGVGTWTLRSESTIVSSVGSSASVAIKGNGKVLGLTNGTNSGSLVSDANASYNPIMCNSLNVNIGTTATETGWSDAKTIGVVTDSSKSGLTGTASVTSNTISVHIWERTA